MPRKQAKSFRKEKILAMMREIADGRSLISVCKSDKSYPTYFQIQRWLSDNRPEHDQLRTLYRLAREAHADRLADEIVQIADDQSLPPESRRVMIDARKWIAGRLKPRTYSAMTHLADGHAIAAPTGPLYAMTDEQLLQLIARRGQTFDGDAVVIEDADMRIGLEEKEEGAEGEGGMERPAEVGEDRALITGLEP